MHMLRPDSAMNHSVEWPIFLPAKCYGKLTKPRQGYFEQNSIFSSFGWNTYCINKIVETFDFPTKPPKNVLCVYRCIVCVSWITKYSGLSSCWTQFSLDFFFGRIYWFFRNDFVPKIPFQVLSNRRLVVSMALTLDAFSQQGQNTPLQGAISCDCLNDSKCFYHVIMSCKRTNNFTNQRRLVDVLAFYLLHSGNYFQIHHYKEFQQV